MMTRMNYRCCCGLFLYYGSLAKIIQMAPIRHQATSSTPFIDIDALRDLIICFFAIYSYIAYSINCMFCTDAQQPLKA